MSFEGTDELLQRTLDFVNQHRATYLASGGTQGHIIDFSHAGAPGMLPTLLLKTIGRRSGKVQIVPLIYGLYGNEWVVVGSKGGAPDHPAWFLNIQEMAGMEFQVATQAFKGSWRIAADDERARIWSYMEMVYPPYAEYKLASAGREIPLVMLKPSAEVATFSEPVS